MKSCKQQPSDRQYMRPCYNSLVNVANFMLEISNQPLL